MNENKMLDTETPVDILLFHYSVVIVGRMGSQITSLKTVYSTVYSSADERKIQRSASLAFAGGGGGGGGGGGNSPVTGEFPTQRASNAENVSIWWHHHL